MGIDNNGQPVWVDSEYGLVRRRVGGFHIHLCDGNNEPLVVRDRHQTAESRLVTQSVGCVYRPRVVSKGRHKDVRYLHHTIGETRHHSEVAERCENRRDTVDWGKK